MLTMTPHESTARTLLNMHLVALYQKGKALALADTTKALQFLADLPAHDQRLSRHLQESHIAIERLSGYLEESLQELSRASSRGFVPMLVPVPPNLELTMDYSGESTAPFSDVTRNGRYLGFYWSASHVYWEDGLGGQTGSWSGYLAWYDHWMIFSTLGSYRGRLGSDDGEIATHEWVLDRSTRLIFIASRKAVQPILARQWPKEAFPDLSYEEAVARWNESRQPVVMPTNEQIWQLYQQEMQEVASLQAWLEQYWPMPVLGRG